MLPQTNSKTFHTALRQIETKIQRQIQRGVLRINSSNMEGSVKELALKTYQEASKQAKECADQAQKGEFFKRAGVNREVIQQILQAKW